MIATLLKNRLSVALLLSLLGVMSGCACQGHGQGWCGPNGGQYFGGSVPVCFGYSSTCWHAWPAECVACPTYALEVAAKEPLPAAKSFPLPNEAAPFEAPVPLPSAAEPSFRPATPGQPPAPEPEEQSQFGPPPPVLTVAPIVTPASLQRLWTANDEGP